MIGRHPHCHGLSIAAGGSFHSWKFMPTIGKYVVKMLLGELEAQHAGRWAWDYAGDGSGALPEYVPRRDLNDLWEKEKQAKL
jgi:sarcosine oxidase/L-pipecolate oxidase